MDSFPRAPDNLLIGEEIRYGQRVFAGLLGTRPVAIFKIDQLLRDYANQSQETLEATLSSFRRECELLAAAKDPHIVEFLGAFNHERHRCLLVMELMDQTLETFLKDNRGNLSKEKQVDICQQIASGLRYLHNQDPQILHSDLSPRSIFMKCCTAKIGDFSSAKFRDPNELVGYNILHMPPECSGHPSPSSKGDVFSLGVVMLEVATQKPPSCSMFGIGTVPEVDRRAKDLSKVPDNHPLKALIRACLKDNPKERPTIEEVHLELLRLHRMFKTTIDMSSVSTEVQRIANLKLMSEMMKNEPQVFRSDVLLKGNKLQSIQLPPLPIPTYHSTAVVIGGKIYVSGGVCVGVKCAQLVQVYDTITTEWTTLPPSPIYNSESTLVNGQLTLIGGGDASTGKITNSTITWDEEKKQWFPKVPPMPTKRFRPCIIHCNNLMLVAGGAASDEKTFFDSVDVFNMDTFTWVSSNPFRLPLAMCGMSCSVSSEYIYITSGAITKKQPTTTAFRIQTNKLVQMVTSLQKVEWELVSKDWEPVSDTPHFDSGLVADSDHPIVVGGHKSDKPTSDVSIYNPTTDKWSNVGQCVRPHLVSCAIAVSSTSFLVIGGRTNSKGIVPSSISDFELLYV